MFDIVYTYVNGDDPSHIKSRRQTFSSCKPEQESMHACRFLSANEIQHSVFSIFRFMDQKALNKIYVVISDDSGQVPSFDAFDAEFMKFVETKVQYVRHSEIIPIQYLPTFNSHVI